MSAFLEEQALAKEDPACWRAYKFMEALRGDHDKQDVKKEIVRLIWEEWLDDEQKERIGKVHTALKKEGTYGTPVIG